MPVLKPDDEIGGYTIIRLIARGGMGEVYLARQVSIDRLVAVKVLFPALAKRDARFADQFLREAQAAGRLNHTHIIAVHNVGEQQLRGVTLRYFSMEYVDGENFRDMLDRTGPIDHRLITQVMQEAGAALAYAARMGMTHHDVKPENIMLTRDGRVKLADFGLAMHHTDVEEAAFDEQGRRKVMGTPRYMSPEQARAKPTDHRSDQYSFGATVFHLITGHPPYRRDTARDLMLAQVSEPVPDPADYCELPEAWRRFIMRLMAKDPDQRYPDPDAFLEAIHQITQQPEPSGRRPARTRRRHDEVPATATGSRPLPMVIVVAALIALGAGIVFWWTLHSPDQTDDDDSAQTAEDDGEQRALERARAFIADLDDDPETALGQLQGSEGLRRPYFQAAPGAMALLRTHQDTLLAAIEQQDLALIAAQAATLDEVEQLIADNRLRDAETLLDNNRILDISDASRRRDLQARQGALYRSIAQQRLVLFRQQQIAIDRADNDRALARLQDELDQLDVDEDQRTQLAADITRRRQDFAERASAQAEQEEERRRAIWETLSGRALRHRAQRSQRQEPDLRSLLMTAESHRPQLTGSDYETKAAELAAIARRAMAANEALEQHLADHNETITVQRPRQAPVPARLLGLDSSLRLLVDLDHSGTRMAVNLEDTDSDLAAILTRAVAGLDEPAAHVAAFLWCYDLPGAGYQLHQDADSHQTRTIVALLRTQGEALNTSPPHLASAMSGSDDDTWSIDFSEASDGVLALFEGQGVTRDDQRLRWHCTQAAPLLTVHQRHTMAEDALPTLRLIRPLGSTTTIDFSLTPGSVLLIGCERAGRRVRVGIDTRDHDRTWLDVALDRDGHVVFDDHEPQSVPPLLGQLRLRMDLDDEGLVMRLSLVDSEQRLPLPTQRYPLPGTDPAHLIIQTIQQEGSSQLDLARIVIQGNAP